MNKNLELYPLPEEWDMEVILNNLSIVGDFASRAQREVSVSLKADGSVLTNVDLAIDQAFRHAVDDSRIGLISEESSDHLDANLLAQTLKHPTYILDPIDGTAPYANCLPIWGISVGYAKNGILCEGAIYLPATQEFFISQGENVYYRKRKEKIKRLAPTQPLTPLEQKKIMIAIPQDYAHWGIINLPNPVHALACAVFPLVYMMLNSYGGFFGRLKLWDYAGAIPLLKKLGFVVFSPTLDSFPLSILASPLILSPFHRHHMRTQDTIFFTHPDFTHLPNHIYMEGSPS